VNSLNSILLEGILTHDPEGQTLPNGTMVCTFTVASDRFYKQNEILEKEVSYFDVEASGRLGQSCVENLKKGRGVRIVGRLVSRPGTAVDSEGYEYMPVYIVAEHVEFKPAFNRAPEEAQA